MDSPRTDEWLVPNESSFALVIVSESLEMHI